MMMQHSPVRPLILFVDDYADIVTTVGRLLVAKGYDVATAIGFDAAVGLCREHRFDLLILDLQLRDRRGDGFDLLDEIRRECGDVEAIVMSAICGDEHVRRAREAGFSDYLLKPVDPRVLLASVSAALDRSRERRGGAARAVPGPGHRQGP